MRHNSSGYQMTYPIKLTPFKHQQTEWDNHRDDDARALLWQMRTGKTKAVIDVACYRRTKGDITGMLIIAPNGVHVNWVRRQLPIHMWDTVKHAAFAWQASQDRCRSIEHAAAMEACMNAPSDTFAIMAVNSESIIHKKPAGLIAKFLRKHMGKCMLVVDESHDFRSPGATRTKRARSLVKYCNVRRILTGTAVSNSPLAAYSQFELLQKRALGFGTFADFENQYVQYKIATTKGGRQYKVLDCYRNLDDLQARLAQWSSVVLREDVDDMPELIFDERTVLIPECLSDVYTELKEEYIAELEDGGEVEALEGGARLIKLQQILSGFTVDSAGELRQLVVDDENPRVMAMLEDVESSDRKVIIWCKFREDIRKVVKALRDRDIQCVEYHGAIHSQAKRQEAIDAFNKDPKVKVFVGQPRAGGVGLDLSAADVIIWYSHTFDLIEREQANERATQIGSKSVTIIDFVTPGSVDEYILANLKAKQDISKQLVGVGLKEKLLEILRKKV